MTETDHHVDRHAVFDRDGETCGHCGATPLERRGRDGRSDAPADHGLGTYAIDPSGSDGTHPRASVVTVCESCLALLERRSNAESDGSDGSDESHGYTPRALFETVRNLTVAQSESITDVVAFADFATALPEATGSEGEETDLDRAAYGRFRREIALTLECNESNLAKLAAVDCTTLDPETEPALEAFHDEARQLQADLRTIVEAIERIVGTLARCHVCLEPLADDAADECPVCSTTRLEADATVGTEATRPSPSDHDTADDADLEAVFRSLGAHLRTASDTTDRVSARASDVAETVVGSESETN